MKILDIPQSGSVGGVTSSRNRYGQYRRTKAMPVNPNTSAQGLIRDRLSVNAAAWRTLTANQRQGWSDLALSMNRSDSLGQTSPMTGFSAFVSVNNNKLNAGDAAITDAPALSTPSGLLTYVITLTSAALSVAYTATPLAAGARLFTYVSPQVSAGRGFNKDFRLLAVSAAAAASPANLFAAYSAKFGVPVTGNRVFFQFRIYTAGFLSGPAVTSQVIA